MNRFNHRLGLSCLTAFLGVALHPGLSQERSGKADDWEFAIVKLASADITRRDYQDNYRNVAKWLITTELVNKSDRTLRLLAVPLYGAMVSDFGQKLSNQVDSEVFLSASHLPLRTKDNDFILIPARGKLVSTHKVYARRDPSGTSYTLFGYFVGHENVAPELKANNFSTQWLLRNSPVGDEFTIAMTLISRPNEDAKKILGNEYKTLWLGRVRSSPATIRTFQKIDWSRSSDNKGESRGENK